jgi:glycosyltransferase involved in cell wall biosynthesis
MSGAIEPVGRTRTAVRKILAVVPSSFCFGLQNAELALFSHLHSRMQCHFLTTRWTDGEFVRRLDALEIPHSSTWLGMFSRRLDWTNVMMSAECLLKLPGAWFDFCRLYRSFRPDIVYVANHHEAILLLPVLLWIRRKVVCHVHDPPPAIAFQKLSFFLWRRGVGRFFFISHSARQRLGRLGLLGAGDIVIHNGVEALPLPMPRQRNDCFCRCFDWPNDSVIFGISGQISPHKGQDDFINAAGITHCMNPKVRFVIGGRGREEYVSALRERVQAQGLENCIKFCGWLPRVVDFYEAIDVFVLASRCEEGFGLVVAEAAERGLASIATRSGGALEIVVDEETGILVDKQSPQALAEAMLRLAADTPLRQKMGERARARAVREFSLCTQADRTAAFLDRVASGGRGVGAMAIAGHLPRRR